MINAESLSKIGLFAEPPPPKPKAVDDWSLFESRENFKLAELIFCETHISAANAGKLMAIVANLRHGEPPSRTMATSVIQLMLPTQETRCGRTQSCDIQVKSQTVKFPNG